MAMKRIYVAGPMTKGDLMDNIRAAIDAAHRLADLGFAPYLPQLLTTWHLVYPRHYESWMAQDFEWISACHGLLRIPGESSGADREIGFALARGIPVFHTVEALEAHFNAGVTP